MSLNRRTFLATSALTAAALVLEGCSSSDETSTNASTSTSTGTSPSTRSLPGNSGGAAGAGGGGGPGGLQQFTPVNLNTNGVSPGGANTADVVDAVNTFLDTLTSSQSSKAVYDFSNHQARQTWSNYPAMTVPRSGIEMANLSAQQRAAVDAMMRTSLSSSGAAQDANIRAADDYLNSLGGQGSDGFGANNDYFVAVYGTPSKSSPFAIQFGGHHLARNLTYNGDKVSQTPQFVGSEPVSFQSGGRTVEPVKPESTSMFGMIAALTADQNAAAHITSAQLQDLAMGPGQDSGVYPTAEGLLVADLNSDQRQLVIAAIGAYAGDLAGDAATKLITKYTSELASTRIGWVNSSSSDGEHSYIRIDGPSVWIEFINTRSQSTPNIHYHSVYRDKTNDYGSSKPT